VSNVQVVRNYMHLAGGLLQVAGASMQVTGYLCKWLGPMHK
jgi:hypothetical protein